MALEFDSSFDWLSDAPLTPDQRRAWNMLRGELVSAQARIQQLQDRVTQLEQPSPDNEPVTLTRADFNREVARMLAFDERYGGVSSVLYFSIDRIDDIIARHGRAVANAAIREIGAILLHSVRGSDIVGRLAPDEFGILLMRCDNGAAWRKAESLAETLQRSLIEIHGCRVDMRVSYGAYTFRDNEDLATGLQEAAQAMTKAVK